MKRPLFFTGLLVAVPFAIALWFLLLWPVRRPVGHVFHRAAYGLKQDLKIPDRAPK
jgi:hypothetical protein